MSVLVLLASLAFGQEPVDAEFGPVLPPSVAIEAPASERATEEAALFQRLLAEPGESAGKATLMRDTERPSLGGLTGALAIAALGAVAVFLWRRREGQAQAPASALRLVAHCAIGNQAGLALVDVGGRRLVVGTGAQPPVLIADLAVESSAAGALVEEVLPEPAVAPVPGSANVSSAFSKRLVAAQGLVDQVLAKRTAG